MKQRVYFFRCGIMRDMSFTSRRTGSFPLAPPLPVFVALLAVAIPLMSFWAGRSGSPSSSRRFFVAGSEMVLEWTPQT